VEGDTAGGAVLEWHGHRESHHCWGIQWSELGAVTAALHRGVPREVAVSRLQVKVIADRLHGNTAVPGVVDFRLYRAADPLAGLGLHQPRLRVDQILRPDGTEECRCVEGPWCERLDPPRVEGLQRLSVVAG